MPSGDQQIGMKKYQSLFIDLDDTIMDTRSNAIAGIRILYNDFRFDQYYPSFEEYYQVYISHNNRLWELYHQGELSKEKLIHQRIALPFAEKGVHLTDQQIEEIHWGLLERVAQQTQLVEGARELLDYLVAKKYRLFILSNGFKEVQFVKLRNADIEHYFEKIILSDDIGHNKPHPKIYYHAMASTNSLKERSLMIGDNFDTDITGAKGVKMDQLFFDNGVDYQLKFQPTYTVKSLWDIKNIL